MEPEKKPAITVVRGRPTPAELAATVAVLLAASAAAATVAAPVSPPSRWGDPARFRARATLPRPGPHSWRASAQPW